jgi:CheY-like chemotaxis protein
MSLGELEVSMDLSHAREARPSGQAAREPRSAPPVPRDRRLIRVLVVDDDADTREVLELVLCPEDGFEMVGCGDSDTCLNYLRAATRGEAPPFDVVFLDLMLPGGRVGTEILEVCASGSAEAPRLPPVVVCTALAEPVLATHLPTLARYGVRVVRKPFSIDTVLSELRAAVGM